MNNEDLKVICDLVDKLTVLKADLVPHVCIDNYSSELLEKLIRSYRYGMEKEKNWECFTEDWLIEVVESHYGSGKAMQVADILRISDD